MAAARRAPALHPEGIAYRAIAEPATGAPLPSGRHQALVRLSRGIGLPQPLPDLLGFAVRVVDAYGVGHHQDLLLTTTSARPRLRYVFLPAHGPFERMYTSLLPYRVDDRRCQIIAVPEPGTGLAPGSHFNLFLRYGPGEHEELLRISLLAPHDRPDGRDIGFDPGNTGGRVALDGLVNRLRLPAYRGSREGRGASRQSPKR